MIINNIYITIVIVYRLIKKNIYYKFFIIIVFLIAFIVIVEKVSYLINID